MARCHRDHEVLVDPNSESRPPARHRFAILAGSPNPGRRQSTIAGTVATPNRIATFDPATSTPPIASPAGTAWRSNRSARAGTLAAGVTIACGSDAGVFTHGTNARELELIVACGMTPQQALAAATTVAARVLGTPELGAIHEGGACGLVVLDGDPLVDIANVRRALAVIREADERRP